MSEAHNNRLVSIVIPCWNQLAFTRHCLQSVFRHTRLAFELIVVDNGSTDGTGAYLAGVADAARSAGDGDCQHHAIKAFRRRSTRG